MIVKVDKMMTPMDAAQVTMLTLMDQICIEMKRVSKPKTFRDNRLDAIRDQIEHVQGTFEGRLPDIFINKAEVFYNTIQTGVDALLKYTQECEGQITGNEVTDK